jgi:hypothetical protein
MPKTESAQEHQGFAFRQISEKAKQRFARIAQRFSASRLKTEPSVQEESAPHVETVEMKKEEILQEIQNIITTEIAKLNQGDYAHVLCTLLSGPIVQWAERLGWIVTGQEQIDPAYYDDSQTGLAIPVRYDLENDWSLLVYDQVSTQSQVSTPPKSPTKSVHFAYIEGLENKNLYAHPHNLFDPNVHYTTETIQRLAKENALVVVEEWLHVLQYEQQKYMSKKLSNTSYEDSRVSEIDAAYYFVESGVDLTDTSFIRRYQRQSELEQP